MSETAIIRIRLLNFFRVANLIVISLTNNLQLKSN